MAGNRVDKTHLQRFAQRGARNAVLFGQLLLVDPGAGSQFMREDTLPQSFGNFLVKRGRSNAIHGLVLVWRGVNSLLTCLHNYG